MITLRPRAVTDRFNAAFSTNGCYGVCLRARNDDRDLESWTFAGEQTACRTIPEVAVDQETQALSLDDGRILLCQRDEDSTSFRHELTLLQPTAGGFSVQPLGAVSALLGGYLLTSPGSQSPNSTELGFFVALDGSEHSTIWRLSASRIAPIARVPGSLSGGVWLDETTLALNLTCDSCRSSGIVVDFAQSDEPSASQETSGSWRRIWSMSDTSIDRVVLASLRSKLFVVSTDAAGEERLGWGRLGERTVHFPEALHEPGNLRQALALDDRGERLLVHEVAGAVSRLFVYTPADDGLEPLVGPAGIVSSPVSWAGDLIRCRFSAPDQPSTLATVRLGAQPRWSCVRDREPGETAWAGAELVELEGPAGPVEAIVYGGSDWRHCEYLVVALHGGPLSSWSFEFDPLFQCLAAAGVAVVAPNYRGSTGYGDTHLRAVIGSWGGPDVEDVLHLARSLERDRRGRNLPRPVVLGASYGAFLALLAACHEPMLWSACVALAPFLSGPRLHESAAAGVQQRIVQLGGLNPIDDHLGPRDVLQVCDSLSVPLLMAHGTHDATIPVEQSRMLRRRLLELGRTEGIDFEYLEVDGDHEEVVLARHSSLSERATDFCRTRPLAG